MIDLTLYSQDEVMAKGNYSIVRAAHEDRKKKLSLLCSQFASITPQVLRLSQPPDDEVPNGVAIAELMTQARALLDKIEVLVGEIEGLAVQRSILKEAAWGR
jgi:hypothetical protein